MAREKEWQGGRETNGATVIPLNLRPVVWDSGLQCSSLLRQYAEASYTVDVSSVEGSANLTPVSCMPACPLEDQDEASLPAGTEAGVPYCLLQLV
jgi:hypothetical protein